MLVDANVLLYAADTTSARHEAAKTWWEAQLNGPTRVGLPWQSIGAFLRIATHPRIMAAPLTGPQAVASVDADFARWPEVRWVNPLDLAMPC